MIIFGNICQIIRKRCQMMKQMRKKAHLEEKYLVLGGFCPKNMVKEQFFCALRGLKILILLNLAQKSLLFPPPPTANSEEYSPMQDTGTKTVLGAPNIFLTLTTEIINKIFYIHINKILPHIFFRT